MNTEILSADKDPMGAAILDFQKQGKAARLRVLSSMFEEDEMPVTHLFRSFREMPVQTSKSAFRRPLWRRLHGRMKPERRLKTAFRFALCRFRTAKPRIRFGTAF